MVKLSGNSLIYLTYQSFPAETANSQQTISNIKYLVKRGMDVSLYFPLREKNSTDDITKIQKFYGIEETFKVFGLSHRLPFGKIKFFNSISFYVSHFIWSWYVVNKYFKNRNIDNIFFTRSEWISFFLSRKECKIIFECHQTSKTRNFIINRLKVKENVQFIFLNDTLEKFYSVKEKQSNVFHNGVDAELFQNINSKIKKQIIFIGNLSRFNKTRDLDFLIECYKKSDILKEYKLKIVGGPKKTADQLSEKVKKNNLSKFITIQGRLDRQSAINEIQKSEIGILINSSNNMHSYEYTSPLKYFEYIYGELAIVAVNFPSHKSLPFQENISFFEENNIESFVKAIQNTVIIKPISKSDLESITLTHRAEKINQLYSI